MLITLPKGSEMMPFFVLTLTHPLGCCAADGPRDKGATAYRPVWVPKAPAQAEKNKTDVFKTSENSGRTECLHSLFAAAYSLKIQLLIILPLADLVVMAGRPHPFPFRTRP